VEFILYSQHTPFWKLSKMLALLCIVYLPSIEISVFEKMILVLLRRFVVHLISTV